jgi:hypothetical protein
MIVKNFPSTVLLNPGDIYRENPSAPAEPPDTSGKLIVGTMIALVAIALLPQFVWFQKLTAITGWLPFLRNLVGW